MAKVGQTFPVGTPAPETGRYQHTAWGCTNTAIFNKGNRLTPCQITTCSNRGADWKLVKILT